MKIKARQKNISRLIIENINYNSIIVKGNWEYIKYCRFVVLF